MTEESKEAKAPEAAGDRSTRSTDRTGPNSDEAFVERKVVPLAEEQLKVDRRQVESGRVTVTTKIGVRQENVDVELTSDQIEVRRIPVGREVDGPVEVREEGDVTIIPVLEEVLVVRKKLILREEVHVRRRSSRRRETHQVDVRYEEPVIERFPPEEAEND